jgi:hypothetical protein
VRLGWLRQSGHPLDVLLLLRLLAGTLLEVAGEGTDHALLTQTDDGGVRAPRAGSREVGSGAAHPTECRWWLGRPAQCRTDDCRDPPSRSANQSRASSPPRAAVEHVLGMVNRCSTTILAWFLAELWSTRASSPRSRCAGTSWIGPMTNELGIHPGERRILRPLGSREFVSSPPDPSGKPRSGERAA